MMKIFLVICLASGLASSEKLDRSYLPPPGSKFSGGTPGDIETPLEFPKQPTRPLPGNGKPEIELGINRRPAPPAGPPDSQKPGFNYFQKSYPVPKTTTSYAITQTTTFSPDDEYTGINQPSGFLNGSTVQSSSPGQNQPIRRPGQGPYNQNRPGQGPSTVVPNGTTARPQFPGVFNGPEYLPPVNNNQSPTQVISDLDGFGYPSGLPQGSFEAVSANENQYIGNPNIPSNVSPSYQSGRFVPSGPGSQQPQNHFPGSQFPSSTAAPQYQDGQRLITPGSNQQNQFMGSQFPSSTAAPQYQDGQRLITPGSNQQNQFIGSQFPSSTAAPQYQDGQRLITPGSNQQSQFSSNQGFPTSTAAPQYQDGQTLITPGSIQQSQFSSNQGFPTSTAAPQYQFGQRFTTPAQQNLFPGNQYLGNKNFPSSSFAPTSGLNGQSQFTGNHNHPSTATPNYPNGQRFTTPGHTQGALNPSQPDLGSPESQNQFAGQNFPSTPSAPQFQDGVRLTTPGYVQEGYGSPVFTQQNQNQYPGNQNYPSSTAPQYQNGQQFITRGPIDNQNFPSTAAPSYQGGQRFTTPGQYEGQYIPEQQISGSRIPGQQSQSQFRGNLNYPSSTTSPQYQDDKRFSTPASQESFDSAQSNQQNQYPVNQNFPTSTAAPQYQDGQRFSTPGSTQTFGSSHGNLGGNQNYPTSTTVPQYQGQRITTPGQLFNQPSYSGSTAAPQYQQTLAPPPGQQGVIPNQQDQFQRPVFNQQFPSSTGAPQGYPGSLPQYGNKNIPSPGTNVAFPDPQGRPGGTIYGNIQQPTSQTGVGSPVFGAGPGFPSTTVGSLPGRDFTSTSGGPIGGSRAGQRPQAEGDRNAEILNYENVLTPEGYFYTYDTSNGIHADETGTVGNGTRAQGGYSYTGDDGKVYSVVYSADENGFQPRGDHLPTPPPIPEAIQRVIDQANRDKESGIDDDGSYNDQKYGYMKYEGPLTQLRPRNRTVSVVNGVEIPVMKEMAKPKGRKPVSNIENGEVFESVYEETDVNGSEADEVDDNENRRVDNLENSKEKNRRIGSKPINTLTSEDNRQDKLKGMKMPVKPTTNSKTIERNGLDRRPISSEQNEDGASDDKTEESEDNDDLQEPQGLDYDADLVNYRDDPNNRTNFHGLNKYLPESKKTNRKNKPSKKHPTVRVNGTKQSTGVNEPKTSEDRKGEGLEDSRPDFVNETRTRIPSRKNKIGQRVKDQSKVTGQSVSDSDDETNSYGDDRTDTGEEHSSDDATKLVTSDRVSIPGTTQSKKKIAGKPKRPNGNERTDMSDKKEIKPNEDNGYDYNPPQRKFGSEEAINLPSMVNQKGAQTTLRPFLTKNVYGDDTEPSDDYDGEYGAENPGRPMSGQKTSGYSPNGSSYNQNNPKFSTTKRPGTSRPFGRPETTEDSYIQNNPEVNDEQGFSTTRRPISYGTSRPFGRPQTTGDSYIQNNPEGNEEQGFSTTRRPISYGTSRPFGRPQTTVDSYNQKYPEVKEEQGFSTTRKPVSYGTSRPFGRPQTTIDSYNQNNPDINDDERFSTTRRPVSHGTSRPFGRPQNTDTPQYQEQGVTGQVYNEPTIQPQRPGDNTPNRGTGGNVFSSSTPLPSEPGYKYQRPGYQNRPTGYDTTPGKIYSANMPGQVPSTTNRPNYSFGDKISTPVTVDAFGRPIQSTNAPFDSTLRPTYSTGRPNESGSRPSDGDQFRPTDGRFMVTSTQGTPGYQSTSAPIGEDFSGPKQLQRFDSKTGYHYK